MAPFTQNATSGIVGFETNEAGNMTRGRINAVPTTGLDTTANLYAVGCVITDSSNGNSWANIGTVAVPVWTTNGPAGNFVQVTVPAASIPLMFGGTNVAILQAPPGGTSTCYALDSFVLEYVGAGGTGFSGGGSTVRLVYGSAGTNVAGYMNLGTATFFGTATKVLQSAYNGTTAGVSMIPGMGIYLDNTTAAYAGGGTSSLKIGLWYSVIPV